MEHGRDAVTLTTDNAFEVKARHVIFATGYEVAKFIGLRGQEITSTWAIATKPQPEALWRSRCLIWEAAVAAQIIQRAIVAIDDLDAKLFSL
jgi:hypothetical protein